MHRWIFLLLALGFGAGAAGAAYLAWRGEEPRGLIASEPIHDCGQVEQGAKIRHEFTLVNRMGETLKIKEVVKSCGCTEVTCEPQVIDPGKRAVSSVVWEVRGARGKSKITMTVLAILPDETVVATELVLVATVKPDIEYAPETLEFSANSVKHTVRFSPGTQREFALKQVVCTHRAFSARILPGASEVEVTFQPSLWSADLGPAELRVETTSKNQPVCRIPLTVAATEGRAKGE